MKQNGKTQPRTGKATAPKKAPKIAANRRRTASSVLTGKRKTKADQILALIKQPGGATLKAIMTATGWQAHSVRGFISGQLIKKMSLRVESLRRDGERVYAIQG